MSCYKKIVFSFKTRIIESDNSLVNGIVTSTIPLFSSIWAWWSDILDTQQIIIVIVCVETITAHLRLMLTYCITVVCLWGCMGGWGYVCVCKCDVCSF